jgi:surface protein
MELMFYKCSQLTSLDLSSFNTSLTNNFNSMFSGCTHLRYINFYNFELTDNSNYNSLLFETPDNLIICINNKLSWKIIPLLISWQCTINDCLIELKNDKKKIVENTRICLDDCFDDEINKYEFDNFCYEKCPKWTIPNKDNLFLCEYKVYECLDSHPFLILQDNSCNKECNCKDFFKNICKLNNNNLNNKIYLISNIIKGIQEGLINESLEDLMNGKKSDIIKMENNTLYQITTSFNQSNKEHQDKSSIILGECET